jgi:hypothetical protein
MVLFVLALVIPGGLALGAYQDYPEISLVGKNKLIFGQAPEDYIDPGEQVPSTASVDSVLDPYNVWTL